MSIPLDLTAEAVDALRWVKRLSLSPGEWDRAGQIMVMLDDALAKEDQNALRAAVFGLDQLALRVEQKIGAESDAPPSPKHRDQANELIHRLTVESATETGTGTEDQIRT